MALSKGTQLNHYEILAAIGEGGMGVVYQARDLNLDRIVALKVLRSDRITEGGHQRFAQEARAASSLNHPNIVQVYDAGSDNGVDYIVMEFVEGRALDELIAARLALAAALRYAVQIAGALTKAHAAGIVHRDLKPSNILIAADGTAKILDFGLAKVLQPAGGDFLSTRTILHEPMHTERGVIMGTVAYMAPEQAEGAAVDARADIFAFGAVLYEMVTGRRAFEGKSKTSTLAAVLKEDAPPISRHVNAPPELDRIVAQCLRKDPERRYQSIADVRVALEDVISGVAAPATPRPRWRFLVPLAVVAAIVLAAFLGARFLRQEPPRAGTPTLSRITADSGLTTEPALSPDGKMIAYASDRSGDGGLDIWVQQLAGGEPIRLTNHPADDHEPAFSPDGTKIVFRSEREGGGVYLVSTFGGEPRLIAPKGQSPRISPSGDKLAYWTGPPGSAFPSQGWIMPLSGGAPKQFQPDFPRVQDLLWSPDGRHVMFIGIKALGPQQRTDLWVAPETGPATSVGAIAAWRKQGLTGQFVAQTWTAANTILFSANHGDALNIWSASIDPKSFQVVGAAERVTAGTQRERLVSSAGNGLVAFSAGESVREVWSIDLRTASGPLTRVSDGGYASERPAISADGRTVAYLSNKSGVPRVWIRDLDGGAARLLTAGPGVESWPLISSDGSRVAFMQPRPRQTPSILVGSVRTGAVQTVCEKCSRPNSWWRDGGRLLIEGEARESETVVEVDVLTGKRSTLVKEAGRALASARYSSDGNWVVFMELIQGLETRQLWIAPVSGGERPIPPARWIRASDGKSIDRQPSFSEDGGSLYYVSNRDGYHCLWVQPLNPQTKQPVGDPRPVRHFHSAALGFQIADSGFFGLSIGGGKMVISLSAATGNIWLLKRP